MFTISASISQILEPSPQGLISSFGNSKNSYRKNVDAVAAMTSRTFAVVVVAYVVSSYSSVVVVDYFEAFVVVHDVGLVGEAVGGHVEAGLADCCHPQADSCSCWCAWGCPWWRPDF